MEEITLLDALQQLWHHKAKRKSLVFEVTFDEGITRKAYFGKSWSRVMGNWQYIVQDGEHAPGFCYNEKAAVSAILGIPGMYLFGNTVKYHIRRKGSTVMSGSHQNLQRGKCDVCDKEGVVIVSKSTFGQCRLSYCEACHRAGAEPYWLAVNTVALQGLWPDDVNEAFQEKIRSILKYLNRSEEVFASDVQTACEEISVRSE